MIHIHYNNIKNNCVIVIDIKLAGTDPIEITGTGFESD